MGSGHSPGPPACERFRFPKSCEIKPLEECLDGSKSIACEQLEIFIDTVWDQDILQGLPLANDFDFRISLAGFICLVQLHEKPIQVAATSEHLLRHDKHAAVDEAVPNPPNHRISLHRSDELECPAHRHDACIVEGQVDEPAIEVA